jgi:GntR family transcriptional regulator, transcriptional repressor for pyruvate dehydrogenase complex
MLKPIGKQRVAEEIVHQLRGLILRGHYATGDKLPPERKLAEELGVNRASLREAIKSLEQMGLVKTRQGDGTRVLDFMQTAGVELVSHLVVGSGDGMPSLDVLDDVLDFRRIFTKDVARLAAQKSTPQDIERLSEIARRAEDPELSHEELIKADFEFYLELTRAAKNRVFQLLINTIRAAVMSHAPFFAQISQPPAVIRKHHHEVIKALQARDAGRAEEIVDQYMSKGQELLAALFPAANPPAAALSNPGSAAS